jgi:hypothetical protein
VPDEPIRLDSFDLAYLECLKEIQVEFEYSDNSRDLFARWRVKFHKRKKKHAIARRGGTVDDSDFGSVFESVHRPRKLRVGKRYFGKLSLEDHAGHVTESEFERLRIRRC